MDIVGEAEQKISRECVENNVKEEVRLSQEIGLPTLQDISGTIHQGLVCSIDMGWQKRASGNRYDSSSGVSLAIGGLGNKIIGNHVCCSHCRVCDEWARVKEGTASLHSQETVKVREHRCPKNYSEGSAKGMEAHAAVNIVRNIYHSSTRLQGCIPAFVHTTVSDDDSSTWSNLQQSLEQLLERHNQGLVAKGLPPTTKKEWSLWPKDKKNQPKKDYGKLNVDELPPQLNLADPNHRCKVLGKHIYPLTKERKTSGKQISKAYAERFKVNFNRALHQSRDKDAQGLRDALLATLEHEFNNHEYCSTDWCRWLKAENDPAERAALACRWMSKDKDATLYESLHAIYMSFLTPKRVQQMHHKYNTQKNEAMNHKISRLCPKNTTYSKSMVLSDRVAWVIAEDSIGGLGALTAVYRLLGIGKPPPILLDYYATNDKKRDHHRAYTRRPEVIYRRRKALNEKNSKGQSNACTI